MLTEETQVYNDFLEEIEGPKLEQRREEDELNKNEKKIVSVGEEIEHIALKWSGERSWPYLSSKKRKLDGDED